jgi:hypothetical protein
MHKNLTCSAIVLFALLLGMPAMRAQTKATTSAAKTQSQGSIPDLSGNWLGGGATFSITDPGGKLAGTPQDDTPYQPWALAKLKAERPHTGANASFDTTDPRINYCDPIGLPRIYSIPNLVKFAQTPDAVYMLFEYDSVGLQVPLNQQHPEDPGPSWYGDSIGKYEGETLIIDTVGFNDKTWLDHVGRPHSDELHLIQRFRRIDHDHLQLDITFDDPKAYTRPWAGHKIFKLSDKQFVDHSCSMSENEEFFKSVTSRTMTKTPGK